MACLPVRVDESSGKGKGLFADVDFDEGDVIFTEEPLVNCQFSWNKAYKYEACEHCMRSLETAEEMCRRLCQDDGLVLPHLECCTVNKSEHVKCDSCDAKYCSETCKSKSMQQYHKTLCLRDENSIKNELNMLEETWKQIHYPPESASIMLVARMIAIVKQSENKVKTIKQMMNFCHQSENENDKIVHKLLGDKFIDQIENLRSQLKDFLYDDSIRDWFSEKGFRSLLALLGTNQQGVGSSSLSTWVKNCDELSLDEKERTKLDNFIDELYEKLEEVSGDFLNCEGVGLYKLQSSCNHSCDPNAEIAFEHSDHKLTLRAMKPIPSGSEIFISYLGDCDLSRSRHLRQKLLSENYLFNCKCNKCEDQANDPDVTSDEEDSASSMDEA
ncbi:protein-lysine N-trimethyltransferase SMYD5-like [Styela clava]